MSYKSFATALILALFSSAGASAGNSWIVRAEGVGPVKIGMTKAQLSAALHEEIVEEEPGSEGCFYVQAPHHNHIAFMVEDGRVVRIDVDAPGIPTSSGLQVGDTEAHARKTYGAKLKVTDHKYVDTGHYLTVKSDDPRYGIRFETNRGKITMYYAGTYEAIQYAERCE